MFREMRRKKQLLPENETMEILEHGKTAVIAVAGDNDYPYAVPINYIYYNQKIYFHCAKTGHKLDAIARNPKVSVAVVDKDDILQEKYTTVYRSVIAFGKARLMDDENEMRRVVTAIAQKYCPDYQEGIPAEVEREFPALAMVEITIDHVTGKEGIELTRERTREVK